MRVFKINGLLRLYVSIYPIMIWRVYIKALYSSHIIIKLPQPKTSPIPHAQNDFISTDITEGKSSILKLVQGMRNVKTWFTLYITLDRYGILHIIVSMINTILRVLVFCGLCIHTLLIIIAMYKCACIMLKNIKFITILSFFIYIYIQSI